uniref:Uncharacterized protein n=1 Tax=Coturnix japonica TaxID=93934 RepID=A0A8C2SRM9_COTJA
MAPSQVCHLITALKSIPCNILHETALTPGKLPMRSPGFLTTFHYVSTCVTQHGWSAADSSCTERLFQPSSALFHCAVWLHACLPPQCATTSGTGVPLMVQKRKFYL